MNEKPQSLPGREQGAESKLRTVFDSMVGTTLGEYHVKRVVGHGSMGVVFEAVHETLGRRVALKVLPPSLGATEKAIRRFLREAQAVAQLDHENIVPIYEIGESGSMHYYAMQYLQGEPLDEALKRVERFDPREAAQMVWTAARAIHFAHQRGIIHRDLKPANIIRTEDGKVIVTDFGLARPERGASLTDSGAMVGTPLYMSPEQVRGQRDEVDRRTDVYSLGATLYEFLTGHPPFTGTSTQEILQRIVDEDPVSPRMKYRHVPWELEVVTMKALEKNPKHRYKSALEFAQDLERFLEGEPVLAKRSGLVSKVVKRVRKHRTTSILVALIAVLIGVFASSFIFLENNRRLEELDRALADGQSDYERMLFVSALENFEHALKIDDDHPQALLGFARAALSFGMSWEELSPPTVPQQWIDSYGSEEVLYATALPAVEAALEINPEEPLALLCRGGLKLRQAFLKDRTDEDAIRAAFEDINEADRISRESKSLHAWRTQKEIAEMRHQIARDQMDSLNNGSTSSQQTATIAEVNKLLEAALGNITHAINLRRVEFEDDRQDDFQVRESLALLHYQRALVYQSLYDNSEIHSGKGLRGGLKLYFELCANEAEKSVEIWSATNNPAHKLIRFLENVEQEASEADVKSPLRRSAPESLLSGLTEYLVSRDSEKRTQLLSGMLDMFTEDTWSTAKGLYEKREDVINWLTTDGDVELNGVDTASRDRAQECYEEAVGLMARTQFNEAIFDKDFLKAKVLLEQAIQIHARPEYHYELAVVLRNLNDSETAARHSRAAAEMSPENPRYLQGHVISLLQLCAAVEEPQRRQNLLEEARATAELLVNLYPGANKFQKLLNQVNQAIADASGS